MPRSPPTRSRAETRLGSDSSNNQALPIRIRATIGLFAFTTAVFGQVQRGRVATDYHGRIVLFETDSALAGESAAPVERILESGLGKVVVTAASPLDILHADSNRTVTWTDPARPGEKITVLMTGLNGQGDSVEWLLSRPNVDEFVRPVYESAVPYAANPHWSVVQLKMPQNLPRATSVLGAVYGNARNGILVATSNE